MSTQNLQNQTAAATPSRRVFERDGFVWDAQDAYLFDIDGTLLRSRDRIHYNSFASSVRSVMGHELNLDGVVLHGNTDPGILCEAFRLARLDERQWQPQLEAVLKAMRNEVEAQRDRMQLVKMPAVDETLDYLQQKGAALGVATGNLESIGWLKLEVLGIRNWFTFGGFSDDYILRSDMIAHAIEQARQQSSPGASVCVVGDTPADISAARANGLPTIAVATGNYTFDQLMEHEPEVCATTLADLLAARSA
ncbi:HAD family hydrolase [Silvibacterium acidisoli]|uniref:HAD family hydrolase n=1 Tax=Acidobacteriaceae bacterium ZG23-2 TaxID=2883246 RepID=UPI00406C724F